MATMDLAYLRAPTGGWAPDISPWECPEDAAPVLDNAIILPGKIAVRGGLVNWADLSALKPLNITGVHQMPGTSALVFGRKAVSATAYVDPWNCALVRPSSAAPIATATEQTYVASGGTAVVTEAAPAGGVPGPRGITFHGTRYYVSYDAASAPVTDTSGTFYLPRTCICKLGSDGVAVAGFTNAPQGCVDIKGYQSRIWGLSGMAAWAGDTTIDPLSLFFTIPLDHAGGNATADWTDPVSGIVNRIPMDGDSTDPGMALATVRNGLLILRRYSLYLLRGTSTANYILQPASSDVGCVDARSVVETDAGVYFVSDSGLMLTNGVSVKNVSGPVSRTMQAAIKVVVGAVVSGFGGYVTAAAASDGTIIVSMGVAEAGPTGHIQPVWCAAYNLATDTWTRITSSLFADDGIIITQGNNYPGPVVKTRDRRVLSIGDAYITQWEAQLPSSSAVKLAASAFPSSADAPATGLAPWTDVDNALYTDSQFAQSVQSAPDQQSDPITLTGFGFNIPTNATITGVVLIGVVATGPTTTSFANNATAQLTKAGVPTGSALATQQWQPRTSNVIVGDSSNLAVWGAVALTPADVNGSGFGVVINAPTFVSGSGSGVVLLDGVTLSVYYTVPNVVKQQSFVQASGLYDVDPSGDHQCIPFLWRSRTLPVVGGTVRKMAQLKRWFLDYIFQGENLPAATTGFTVKLQDSSGQPIAGTGEGLTVLPATNDQMAASSVSGGPNVVRQALQRISVDASAEVSDMAVQVQWVDSTRAADPDDVVAEVHGVGIEYQQTRDLR